MSMVKTLWVLVEGLFSKPMTIKFPHEAIEIPDAYRGEHKFDIDRCASCGFCAEICPNKAIEMVKLPEQYTQKYKKTYPRIDLRKCCFCALCQDICVKKCLKMTKNVFLATPDPASLIKDPMPKVQGEE
ncbi:MAG: 4Fe-4S dicluster domain-containing protein [Desulfobacterales bacterium]|nr:4Fe-4S dicluster domain-containing protein [Desulfobacterales bacterium]